MTTLNRRITSALLLVALAAAGCADPPADNRPAFTGDADKAMPETERAAGGGGAFAAPERRTLDGAAADRLRGALDGSPAGCEELVAGNCLLPFPSNAFTTEDNATTTAVRVNLPSGQLANAGGTPLDVTEWNRNDGFSPSSAILVPVPGVDLVATGAPTIDSVHRSVDADTPTILLDADNGTLVPHWAELDARAEGGDPMLIIRPAVSLRETHRFVVGLRHMRGSAGTPLPAPAVFQAYRDNARLPGDDALNTRLDERAQDMESVFQALGESRAAADRSSLYLAWDFTVASPESIAGRVLQMRDDGLGRLGGSAPNFRVTGTDSGPEGTAILRGTFDVPLYLTGGGAPGSRMNFRQDTPERPEATGTYAARFTCLMPGNAEAGTLRPVVYGHGLLGSREEVTGAAIATTVNTLNAAYCATDWIGMSEEDINQAVGILGDLSLFPTAADRMQQGLLNTVMLGRLLRAEGGLSSADELRVGETSLLDTTEVFFDGNSQGGIMGGAATAISTEWTRAVLGVTGMNYSTMLDRSVDFDRYFGTLSGAYPNRTDQLIAYNLMQMLWDRGETAGYVQHLTDRTYSGTPAKTVLLQVAFGDHQVPTVQAEIMARTLNIPYYLPESGRILADDRGPYSDTARAEGVSSSWMWKVPSLRKFPHTGSALYFWDAGTPAPPAGNTPNRAGEDPHGDVRVDDRALAQKDAFLDPAGVVDNVCNNGPCTVG